MVLYWCSRYAVIVKICSYITPLQRTKSSCLKSHICKDFFMPLPCVAQLYHRIKKYVLYRCLQKGAHARLCSNGRRSISYFPK